MDFFENLIAKILLVIAVTLVMLRLVPALWGSLFLLLLLLPVVGIVWWLLSKRHQKTTPKTRDGLIEAIQTNIKECEQQVAQFRKEASEIRYQYQELAAQMERAGNVDPLAQEKGSALLTKFDNEMDLRLAKAAFFESSLVQLQRMLENRRLQQKLEESEAALEQWQSANFDDVAALESMRERIKLDQAQLELISDLAQRAVVSPNLQQAVALRKELEKLGGLA